MIRAGDKCLALNHLLLKRQSNLLGQQNTPGIHLTQTFIFIRTIIEIYRNMSTNSQTLRIQILEAGHVTHN